MTENTISARSIATVLCLALVVPALSVSSTPVAANHTGTIGAKSYSVMQGDRCITVEPLGNGSETVESFYDYRNPYTVPNSTKWASHGTTDIQENQVSKLFIYNGSNGTSLVFIHDKWGHNSTNGSTISMNLTGLPPGSWVVQDDRYTDQDDKWNLTESSASIDWKWIPHRADGGAYRGLEHMGPDDAIVLDPSFDVLEHWGNTRTTRPIQSWVARTANGTETSLDMDHEVRILPGPCSAIELTGVSLDPQRVSPDEPVTVTATFENTGRETGRATANFSIVGDLVDTRRTSVDPGVQTTVSFNQTIASPGEFTVAVNGIQRTVTVVQPDSTTTVPSTSNANTIESGTTRAGWIQDTQLAVAGVGVLVVCGAILSRFL